MKDGAGNEGERRSIKKVVLSVRSLAVKDRLASTRSLVPSPTAAAEFETEVS